MAAKRVSFVLSVVVVSLVLAGTARAEVIGWWKLDGNALDSSGNGHDGVVYGGPEWVTGLIGGALKFDGVDDRVEVPGTSQNAGFAATGGEVTWAMWFKTGPSAAIQTILCQGPAGGAHVQGNRSVNVEVSGVIMVRAHSVGALTSLNSTATVHDNEWHHIAVTLAFDTGGTNDTMNVYIDGDLNKGYVVDNVNINQYATPAADFVVTLGYRAGSPFAGTLDDVQIYNQSLSDAEVQKVMRGRNSATSPSPADGASDVPRDVTLSWSPGQYPGTHDVYLGTTFADANTASRADTTGLLAARGQTATAFEPAAPLAYGQTYYWRIDEVNQSADGTIYQGDVWSFTTEPYAYPVTPVAATASDSQPGLGPEKTIDGSGMTGDLHGADPTTMWATIGAQPAWVQYEFDKVYKLYQLSVWNSNQLIESFLGFGARTVTIETSADGTTWTPLAEVPEFNQAPGAPDYAANTTVSLGGAMAKYVKLTIESNWGGVAPQTGLSEVRFTYVPLQAREPQPADGATAVSLETSLDWRPGREAGSHEVYLGTDADAVLGGTVPAETVTDHSYTPAALGLWTTYYWRVDGVNDVTYPGEVWSFTTQEYLVVDDFEGYGDDLEAMNTVFDTWIDGFNNPAQNGSVVGLPTAVGGTFCETTVFHGDGASMPFAYDNTAAPLSEATRTFDTPQDWTAHGIRSLSLWFQGTAGNSGQLYVKINGTKVVYDGDAGDLARPTWLVWDIDLSKVGNVRSVRTLTIGVEGAAAQGTLYIDDVRLYPKAPEYITPTPPADTALEAHYTFDEGAGTQVRDSSGHGYHGTINGTPQWVAGKLGGAMAFSGSTSDYVEAPEIPNVIGMNSRTVTAWIKTTEYGEIASWGENVAGQKWIFRVQESNGTLGAIRVEVNGGYQVGNTDVRDDEWHHVAAVLDSDGTPDVTEISLYVDGLLETNSATLDEPIDTAAGVVRIGLAPWHDRPFNGLIDDVQIYSRPLSAAELAGMAGRTAPVGKPF